MEKSQVTIIILTYKKGLSHVKNCLKSLGNINYKSIEIILVDNGSEDETAKYVKKNFPNVRLIKNKKNLGFCHGNNQAAKISSGKYLLFLNNDAVVTPNFLNLLVKNLENDKTIGVVQPKIRQLIKKNKLDACASYLTNTGFLYHFGYSQNQSDKKYNKRLFMYSAKGACFLTRRDLVKKIGLFDNDYFAYFEETDFCHRVWLSGFKVLYEPKSEIFHLGGVNHEVSSTIIFHSYKNRINTYLKNFEPSTFLKIVPFHVLTCLVIAMVYLVSLKVSYSLAVVKALVWNLINVKRSLSKRKFVQAKVRTISDESLLSMVQKNVKVSYYIHLFFVPRETYDFEEI